MKLKEGASKKSRLQLTSRQNNRRPRDKLGPPAVYRVYLCFGAFFLLFLISYYFSRRVHSGEKNKAKKEKEKSPEKEAKGGEAEKGER